MEMKKYKLGDILVNHDRRRIPLSSKVRSGIKGNFRYYGAQGVVDYIDDYIFDGEYVLIAEDGENLRSRNQNVANLVSGQFWVNNHAHIVTTNEKCDLHYFYYAFNFLQIDGYISGSAQPKLSQDSLNRIEMTIPDLQTQKGIASFLFTIDKRIENLRAQNRVLEQTAKTIYDYTFLQCAGHQTTYNKTLNRNIPTNWEVKKMKEVCKVLLGGTPSTKRDDYWLNGTVNWLNSGEVAEFPIIDCEKKITKKAVEESSTVFLPKGSVTLSITRYLRPSILAIDACINQSVAGILENGILKKSYLFPMLKTEVPKLNALRGGAQQPHINKDIVENINVVIPPKDVLDKYYSVVNPIYEKILVNSEHLKELIIQRNALLPLLMTGQIEVG